jgi:transmembrane 9 superfamily protein 3
MQLISLAFGVVLLAIAGSLYVDRGALMTVVLVLYAFTSVVAGYVSGSLFKRYDVASSTKDKSRWMYAMALTAVLFPAFVFGVASVLNIISIYNAAINVVSLGTFLAILAMYIFVSWPLTILGTVLGRHTNSAEDSGFPCRINALPRPIPERTFFSHPATIIAVTGILPFGAVFIEIFFIFSSMWSQKFYYVYGFLLLVLLILIVVTVCVTVVAVYFQLNSEDWRWPWTAFLSAASTAGYVFLYGIYYFWFKTSMTGFLQTNYYFGYLGLFALALGLMCGAIGFVGASAFVQRIFRNIKVD